MRVDRLLARLLWMALCFGPTVAAEGPPKIAEAQFHLLHALVQPCEGESPWREIAWQTNVTEARRRAIAQDKPLVIFTAADGSPLGRT